MEVNNECRRLKQKMTLLELEGANSLLFDVIDIISDLHDEDDWSTESKLMIVSILKTKYLEQWEKCKIPNPSQGKLFIVKD